MSAYLIAAALGASASAAAAPSNVNAKEEAGARAACQALVQVRGVQLAAHQTLSGDAAAFDALAAELARMEAADRPSLPASAQALLARRATVLQVHEALRQIPVRADDVQEAVDSVFSEEASSGKLNVVRMAVINQLQLLAQRIPRSAGSLIVAGRADPDAVYRLARDVKTFKDLLKGLREGNAELRILPTKDKHVLEKLKTLESLFSGTTAAQVHVVLADLKGWVEALELQAAIQSQARASDQALAPVCFGDGNVR